MSTGGGREQGEVQEWFGVDVVDTRGAGPGLEGDSAAGGCSAAARGRCSPTTTSHSPTPKIPNLSVTEGSLRYSTSRQLEDRAPDRPSDTVELFPVPFAALLGRALALLYLLVPQTASPSVVGPRYPLLVNALASLVRLTGTSPWITIGADTEDRTDANVRIPAEWGCGEY
jgi:hypothetical protein